MLKILHLFSSGCTQNLFVTHLNTTGLTPNYSRYEVSEKLFLLNINSLWRNWSSFAKKSVEKAIDQED